LPYLYLPKGEAEKVMECKKVRECNESEADIQSLISSANFIVIICSRSPVEIQDMKQTRRSGEEKWRGGGHC